MWEFDFNQLLWVQRTMPVPKDDTPNKSTLNQKLQERHKKRNNTELQYFSVLTMPVLIPWRFVTMIKSLHHYYIGQCPLSKVHLIYTMFRWSWLYCHVKPTPKTPCLRNIIQTMDNVQNNISITFQYQTYEVTESSCILSLFY